MNNANIYLHTFQSENTKTVFLHKNKESFRETSHSYCIRVPVFSLRRGHPLYARGNIKHLLYPLINELGVFFARLKFVLSVGFFFLRVGRTFSTVVIGDFRSVPMRQFFRFLDLKNTEFVLVDDGSITPEIMAYRRDGSHANEIESRVAVHARKLVLPDPYGYAMPEKFTFFTIYDGPAGPNDTIIRNTFYEDFGKNTAVTLCDEVWLCGANHVESGIAHQDAYARACRAAAALFSGQRLVYYSHRREDEKRVAAVTRSIRAARGHAPDGIEQYVATRRTAARTVISFGSTVLDTLPLMLHGRTAFVLLIPDDAYFTGTRQDHLLHVMRHNMRRSADVTALFCADAYAPTRGHMQCMRSDAPAYTAALSACLVAQVMPHAADGATLTLRLGTARLTLRLVPDHAPPQAEAEYPLTLRYQPRVCSSFFQATTPVVITRDGAALHIASNTNSIRLPLADAALLPDATVTLDAADARTGARRIRECAQSVTPVAPEACYVVAW